MLARPEDFFRPELTYALVGATNSKGSQALHLILAMEKAGYKKILPISKHERHIADIPTFPDVTTARPFADVVLFAGQDPEEEEILSVLREMQGLRIKKAVFFPGNTSHKAESLAQELFIHTLEVDNKFLHTFFAAS